MVLDRVDGPSFLATSLSVAMELLVGQVDATAANEVRWGTRSAVVASLLHFSELEAKVAMMEDQADVL
jgi:hypothetical protein